MIWKLVKHYKTDNECLIKEFDNYENAVKLFNVLNTESDGLGLELFFEDLIWNLATNEMELGRFTVRSAFEYSKTRKLIFGK